MRPWVRRLVESQALIDSIQKSLLEGTMLNDVLNTVTDDGSAVREVTAL